MSRDYKESAYSKLESALEKAECNTCGGIGECNDAGPGDMYFNSWVCHACKGSGICPSLVKPLPTKEEMRAASRKKDRDTHTQHCCVVHGCKYGDGEKCPVVAGEKIQSKKCETCHICSYPERVVIQVFGDVKLEDQR